MDARSEAMAGRFNLPTLIAALLVIPVIAIEELQIGEPCGAPRGLLPTG